MYPCVGHWIAPTVTAQTATLVNTSRIYHFCYCSVWQRHTLHLYGVLRMVPVVSGIFDNPRFLYEAIASISSAVALWAQMKATGQRREDALADLTERLRRPVRWSLKHPLQATRRALRRRDRQ